MKLTVSSVDLFSEEYFALPLVGHWPLVKCCDCEYWSGQIGSDNEYKREYRKPIDAKVLICAVRICPQPEDSELELVDGRLAHASHYCNDFEQKIQ